MGGIQMTTSTEDAVNAAHDREQRREEDIHSLAIRLQHSLADCPFCGGENKGEAKTFALHIFSSHRVCWCVKCDNCQTRGPLGDDPQEAHDGWNQRTKTDGQRRLTADSFGQPIFSKV